MALFTVFSHFIRSITPSIILCLVIVLNFSGAIQMPVSPWRKVSENCDDRTIHEAVEYAAKEIARNYSSTSIYELVLVNCENCFMKMEQSMYVSCDLQFKREDDEAKESAQLVKQKVIVYENMAGEYILKEPKIASHYHAR